LIKRIFWILTVKIFPHWKFSKVFYSQYGEDMVLLSFLDSNSIENGFYVDIGAHHPWKFSNTAYFYKHGWSGINIEASPDLMKEISKYRTRDINIPIGVANEVGTLKFYEFVQPAFNSFDDSLANEKFSEGPRKLVNTREVSVRPLCDILDEHLPNGREIDFLTIDVEGLDLEVLKSNNWEKYRPRFVLAEDDVKFSDLEHNKIYSYLTSKNYSLVARTLKTFVFELDA